MDSKSPIGILDSGIGGLTVWTEIIRLLPAESTIYYADSANCPYGSKSYPQIVDLARQRVEELIQKGVKMVVIACNTITAASISLLRDEHPQMLFVGMEPATKPAAQQSRSGVIGILATQATLAGELYQNTAETLPPGIKIIETAGNGLVELIEKGMENSSECIALTRSYIEPMMEQGADCIVLGCTHFPLLSDTINKISGGGLMIINPAPAVARRVEWLLASNALTNNDLEENASHTFLSSGDAESLKKVEQTAKRLREL